MYSSSYEYFSTSLTLMASVAESVDHAKLLKSDMKDRKWNYFIKLRKRKADGTTYGSFYDVMDRSRISGTNPNELTWFLRCQVAVKYGNLEILQWIGVHGHLWWHEEACAKAAECGHLEILQWLRANGSPWDEWTCTYAARNGHLEVLQWARANGCP